MILTRCVPIRRLLGPLAFATEVSEAEPPPEAKRFSYSVARAWTTSTPSYSAMDSTRLQTKSPSEFDMHDALRAICNFDQPDATLLNIS